LQEVVSIVGSVGREKLSSFFSFVVTLPKKKNKVCGINRLQVLPGLTEIVRGNGGNGGLRGNNRDVG
jgi:hypothetical protein